ncbi:hypothetical protein Lac2_25840 [Claveliimonas bilis]|uniref:helix-turn-helix domain-containing protein n=1 Tax=Claveliimonas bilis TaxID=3028070 RepID=UPI002931B574|nr:helix-turn-helix domain-containing protein [Claveliimonas bilis]BDZ84450.1 hypothetical protein Lac2_25840 [Claveliimonas bilis]
MAKTKYVIALTDEQRQMLNHIIYEGKESERTVMRAKILLLSDVTVHEKMSVPKVAEILGTTHTTVQTVRTEYGKYGIEAAVFRKKRADNSETRRINTKVREKILEVAAENPPEGRKRWSLRLLCKEVVERGIIDHISVDTMSVIIKSAKRMDPIAELRYFHH